MTEKQLSDKEKALIILKKASEEFNECAKAVRELSDKMYDLQKSFESIRDILKRGLNEEENGGNVHKNCEYYNSEKDFCGNYLMGKYIGLAFEVSRHDKCIKELVDEND